MFADPFKRQCQLGGRAIIQPKSTVETLKGPAQDRITGVGSTNADRQG
jgi:hypothetical protein